MDKANIIEQTRAFLEEKFNDESSGHDYWHMHRVWQLAKHIAKSEEGVDMFTLELAALLHDVADWKFHDGDEEAGPRAAHEWLKGLNVDDAVIEHIEDIIRNVSFKGANVGTKLKTIEGQIVHDADKLDAIGAIGIGRAFAYGGSKGRPMHDPNITAVQHDSFEAYKNNNGPTINHFYEKLLLLKDRMFTKSGKELARYRHKMMEEFLKEFLAEWDGKR
ncbi:MAG TPA: HD domain-containing protein [Candidatus Saccharimonadales bacterium]|nr:HD domain-containing protein [Candidatus Saccharimonadales bacterium]